MMTVEGMEELRALGRRVLRNEATPADEARVRNLLASVDPNVAGFAWPEVKEVMFFALGVYAFGYLGQKAALREAQGKARAA